MSHCKYFGTDGIRGEVGLSHINPEFVLKLGWALGRVLGRGSQRRVLIGKDTRISGYMFESALEAGLSAAGMDVMLLGPMPTPAIAYLTQTLHANAGIVISASHNLFQDNGIKFFSADGSKLSDEIEQAIEAELEKPLIVAPSTKLGRAKRINDAPGRYIEFCKSTFPTGARLTGLKIVVDCANGATYHIAPNVFRELDAEVISLGNEPDGFNINHNCGSTNPKQLQARVLATGADVGVALDGDGDRVIMVDAKGQVVDGDQILYIIAKDRMQNGRLQGGVVGTLMTNFGLEQAFADLNIPFVRTKVGDRYVLETLKENQWKIGGEASGHVICLDKTTTGDGIVAALQVFASMIRQEKSLEELALGLKLLPQKLCNLKTNNAQALSEHPEVLKKTHELSSLLHKKGRVLLRPSGTEPVLRIMVEGMDEPEITRHAERLRDDIMQIEKKVCSS